MADDPTAGMTGDKVDHILRAAGSATGLDRFVLVGSAAIFAWEKVVPPELAMTREVDLFAYDRDDADEIAFDLDASLGAASPFDETYGYYCDGVGPDSAILPAGWEGRSRIYASPAANGVTAVVPHPNDIALSKLAAGRPKDIDWLVAAARFGMISLDAMQSRFYEMPPDRVPPSDLQRTLEVVTARLAR